MNKRILLVDCSPKLRRATREKLEGDGLSVFVATTGADVAAALKDEHFDLVLLEPVIPGLDGFKFCQAIKRDMGAAAPIVVLASRIFRGGRLRTMSRDAGADAHFERPQQDDALYAKLAALLGSLPEPAATAGSPGSDPAGLVDDVVELPQAGSGEDDDSLTSMVPEPSFLDGLDSEIGAALASGEPPRFEELSAPQPAPAPGTNPGAGAAIELPMDLGAAASGPATGAEEQEDEDSGLHAISEDDIDDALARALGDDTESGDLGGTVFPDDLASGLTDQSRVVPGNKAVDSPVAFLEDVDPQAVQPEPVHAAPKPVAADQESFALLDLDDGEDEQQIPRRATAAPALSGQALPGPDPRAVSASTNLDFGEGDSTTGEAGADPEGDALVKSPAELDELLEKAFGGLSSDATSESPDAQPAEIAVEPPPVPESLQGMDASTADLLSSLAELETSIPGARGSHAWQAEVSTPEETNPSLPVPPPPSPEEELTLEEIFSRVSPEDDASPGAASAPAIGAEAPPLEEVVPEPEVVAVAQGESGSGEKPKRRGWKRWFLGSLALAAIAIGTTGVLMIERPAGLLESWGGSLPSATQAPESDVGEAAVSHASAEQVADEGLSTLRRSIDPDLGEIAELPDLPPAVEESVDVAPPPARPALQAASTSVPVSSRPEPEPARQVEKQALPDEATDESRLPDEALTEEVAEKTEPAPEEEPQILLVPLGDLDEPLERLVAPAPPPTEAARDAGVRARAFVNVLVGSDGRVKTSRTMMDPGYGLGEVARQATLGWRYSVPRYEGAPAEVWKTEAVEFDASDAKGR